MYSIAICFVMQLVGSWRACLLRTARGRQEVMIEYPRMCVRPALYLPFRGKRGILAYSICMWKLSPQGARGVFSLIICMCVRPALYVPPPPLKGPEGYPHL